MTFISFVCLSFERFSQKYLQNDVCNKMWNKATNTLKIPSELTVQPASPTLPLFKVTPAGAMKTASQEFVVFQGNLPVRG